MAVSRDTRREVKSLEQSFLSGPYKNYEKFLDRLKFNPMPESNYLPLKMFGDCLNCGVALYLSKQGHPCFHGTKIMPAAVRTIGFKPDEIERLFNTPKVSHRRRFRHRINNRLYRERRGSTGYASRRRKNISEYKKIASLREKGLTKNEIAVRLGIPYERVRYLIQCYKDK